MEQVQTIDLAAVTPKHVFFPINSYFFLFEEVLQKLFYFLKLNLPFTEWLLWHSWPDNFRVLSEKRTQGVRSWNAHSSVFTLLSTALEQLFLSSYSFWRLQDFCHYCSQVTYKVISAPKTWVLSSVSLRIYLKKYFEGILTKLRILLH